jgi:hypothetical protein
MRSAKRLRSSASGSRSTPVGFNPKIEGASRIAVLRAAT